MSANEMTSFSELAQFAGAGRVSLPGETIGYLVLLLADKVAASPCQIHPSGLYLDAHGKIVVRAEGATSDLAEQGLRRLLAWLLGQVRGESPNLRRVADRGSVVGLPHLVSELEAALVPVNRRAGERSLARLARDAQRARACVSRDFAVVSQSSWDEAKSSQGGPSPVGVAALAWGASSQRDLGEPQVEWVEQEVAVTWEPFAHGEPSPEWAEPEEDALTRALPVWEPNATEVEHSQLEDALTRALPVAVLTTYPAPTDRAQTAEAPSLPGGQPGASSLPGLQKLDALARLHLFQSPEPPDEYSTADVPEELTRDLREVDRGKPERLPSSVGRRPFVVEPPSEPDPDRVGPLLESRKAEPFRPSDVGELSEQLVLGPRSLADLYQDLGRMARVDHSPEPPPVG